MSTVLALCFIKTTYPLAIIWDFENTLVKVDRLKMAKSIGLSDFVLYTLFDFKNPFSLIDEVFHMLGHIRCKRPTHELLTTTDQKQLPYIFSHWLDGTWEYNQIKQIVNNLVKSFSSLNYFDSERHQRLIENTMKNMFDPAILSNSIIPIRSTVSILKSCVLKQNENGKLKHVPYLLSNLASDTFDRYIQTPMASYVLGHIPPQNIVLSGDIGMVKPNEDIFLYFLKKFNLNPKECVFIDDQISNINAAKKLGIYGILVENSNYRRIKNELKALQVI